MITAATIARIERDAEVMASVGAPKVPVSREILTQLLNLAKHSIGRKDIECEAQRYHSRPTKVRTRQIV